MKFLELTFSDSASNLACDEALLDLCEGCEEEDVLRVWEAEQYFVVVGYSNKVASEVNVPTCAAKNIPIFRRCTGGGAVLQGPGCLNYALILKNGADGIFGDLVDSYRFVLRRHQRLFQQLLPEPIAIEGISDLAIAGRKFSGNSQHRKRRSILIQGTFLLNFDTSLVDDCLRLPSRQPAYRRDRPHHAFIRNLLIDSNRVREGLKKEWMVDKGFVDVPYARIDTLVKERYSREGWNFKF